MVGIVMLSFFLIVRKLLLADEPTGNLDPASKDRVLGLLLQYVQSEGATLVTVTHDRSLLKHFDQVIDFRQFQLQATP